MYGILVRWYGEAVFLFYCLSLQVGTSEYNAGLSLERERERVIAMNMKYMICNVTTLANYIYLLDWFGIYVAVMPFSASFFFSTPAETIRVLNQVLVWYRAAFKH